MISPNNASLDYGALLKAPGGYTVDFAIATTYSLDMKALMGAYLSLGLSVDTDSNLAEDPMYLFAALSEMRDRVLAFCEKGRIVGRGDYPALYCQLESGIMEVDLPEVSNDAGYFKYPSFHPKTWLIRFTPSSGEGPARYRVCVLSRNLTFDGSWDLACSSDGEYREQHKFASEGGYSIQAYVRQLKALYGNGPYSAKLDTVMSEIAYVNFGWKEKGYRLALPLSYTGVAGAKTFAEEFAHILGRSSRVMVMTPFISSANDETDPLWCIAQRFDGAQEKPLLVTRRSSISSNPKALTKLQGFSLYAVRDDLVTAQFERDEGKDDAEKPSVEPRDIHAKAYLFERAGETGQCDLFIGSANASPKGFYANQEAMMHLSILQNNSFDRLLGELGLTPDEIEKGSLFEPVLPESLVSLVESGEDDSAMLKQQRDFDHFLRKASFEMRIQKSESEGLFEVAVTVRGDELQMGRCTIALATQTVSLPLQNEVMFGGVALQKLTELVRVSCNVGESKSVRLMKCKLLKGAEYLEQQRRELFKMVTKGRFTEYLEFRLSGNPELVASLAGVRGASGLASGSGATSRYDGLYESLLRSYTAKPLQTDALVTECLEMLTAEQGQEPDEEIMAIRKLLETVQKGARYAC